jgi:hypothetical protein
MAPEETRLKVQYLEIVQLVPYASNARTHSVEQLAQIAASIREFGWTNPVLLDGEKGVIAGHGRLLAAQQLGLKRVPCIELAHLTDAQKRAYVIADNQLALNAGWDLSLLAGELQELKAEDFDLNLLGFDTKELSELLTYQSGTEGLTDPDEVPETPEQPVTKPGDLWILGKHRLLCGDATKREDVEPFLNHAEDVVVITDPPYGVNIVKIKTEATKGVGGGGKPYGKRGVVVGANIVKPSLYAPVINDDSTDTAENFYRCALTCNLSNLIIFGGNYFTHFLPPSPCWIIWDKQNSGNFAPVEIAWTSYKRGSKLYQWTWNGLSRAGERKTELMQRVHPTQKPVGLFEKIFVDFPFKNCFDGFLGSGSTLIACEKTARTCFGMELAPAYCDVIVTRWQNFTGNKAVLDGTKQTFDQISQKRAA